VNGEDVHGPHYPRLPASSGGLASTTTNTSSGDLLATCQLSPSTSASAEPGASISGDMFRTIC